MATTTTTSRSAGDADQNGTGDLATRPASRRLTRSGSGVVRRRWTDIGVALLLTGVSTVAVIRLHRLITRPLWYDEQWRALHFSMHGHEFWSQLRNANAPSAFLYVAATKISTALFGQVPWALRLPVALAVPCLALLTYVLARRFTSVPGAIFASAVVAGAAGALRAAFMLKPYLVEAAASAGILLLWQAAGGLQPDRARHHRRILLFTAAGVAACLSVPGIFLLVPLAATELLTAGDALRRRLRAFADAVPGLLIVVLHTVLFVNVQSSGRTAAFDFPFAAGHGWGGDLHMLGLQTRDLATGTALGWLSTSRPLTDVDHLGWVAPVVAGLVILGWLTAAATLWRIRHGVQLLAVAGFALVGTAVASTQKIWPYGLVRTNIFLLPVLTVLAVAGWTAWWRAAAKLGAASRSMSFWTRLPLVMGGTTFRSGILAAGVGLLLLNGAQLDQWRVQSHGSLYGDQVTQAAMDVRAMARPGDLVAYGSGMAIKGWKWSLDAADGGPPGTPRVAPADQLGYVAYDDGSITTALRRHDGASMAFVWMAKGAGGADSAALSKQFHAAGWCLADRRAYPSSGLLNILRHCPS